MTFSDTGLTWCLRENVKRERNKKPTRTCSLRKEPMIYRLVAVLSEFNGDTHSALVVV